MFKENLRKVIWRLEELDKFNNYCNLKELRNAIMLEIGTDDRTIKNNLKKLKKLKYIKRLSRWEFKILMGSTEIA